jgi:septal ring factor EnvC (AmiA/AmiB activator)
MHRSGTSLCSGLLHKLGVDMATGDLKPHESNPLGHWERNEIVDLHDSILHNLGRDWKSLLAMPSAWWRDPAIGDQVDALRSIVADGLSRSKGLWGFKDPRTMRMLPLWRALARDLDVELKIVLCMRHPQHVATSLEQRNGLARDYSEFLWIVYHFDFFQHLSGLDWMTVGFDQWLDQPLAQAQSLTAFCGVESWLDQRTIDHIVQEWIDPQLYRCGVGSARGRSFGSWFYEQILRADTDSPERHDRCNYLFQIASDFALFSRLQAPLVNHLLTATVDTVPKARLVDATTLLEDSRGRLAGADTRIDELEAKCRELEECLATERTTVLDLAGAVAKEQERCSSLEGELGALGEALAATQGQLDQARTKCGATEGQIAQATADRLLLEKQLAGAIEDWHRLESEQNALRIAADARAAEGSSKVDALSRQLTESQAAQADLTNSLANEKDRGSVLEEGLAALKKELASAQVRLEQAQTRCADADSQLMQAAADRQLLEEQLAGTKENCARQLTEESERRVAAETLASEHSAEVDRLFRQLKEAQDGLAELRRRLNAEISRNREERTIRAKQQEELQPLAERGRRAEAEIAGLQDEVRCAQECLAERDRLIASLQERLGQLDVRKFGRYLRLW